MMSDYKAVGALSEALSSHADQVLAGLSERQRQIIKVAMCRLTERGVGKRDIRRPARAQDIADVANAPIEDVVEVVEQLRQQDRSFLTPPPPAPIGPETVLDIGHESLIRQWHTLTGWVEEEAASAAMYRRMLQTAHLWLDGKAELWTSLDLYEALRWKRKQTPSPAWASRYGTASDFELAMRFLEESEALAAQIKAKAELEQQQKAEAQRQRYLLIRRATIGMGMLAAAAIGLAIWAFTQSVEAEQQRSLAVKVRGLAEMHADKASKASVETERQRAEAERQREAAQDAAADARREEERAFAEKAEADKQRARVEMISRGARSREIAAAALQQSQGPDPVLGLLLALEAERVAQTPQADGALQQAMLATGKARMQVNGNATRAAYFLGNDRFAMIQSSSVGGEIKILSLDPESKPVTIETYSAPKFSPDGKYVAFRDAAGSLRIAETGGGRETARMDGIPTRGRSVRRDGLVAAFSPDSRYLAAVGADGQLWVWKAENGAPVVAITDAGTDLSGVTFSPDGRMLLSTYTIYTGGRPARLWRVATGELMGVIGNEANPVGGQASARMAGRS
ncbi:hypothetical protein [Cupriavidus necator]|uniref:WD40 repeat domain-containing protein n=1 Tax=Cupriavidus necator TaxID=106590 RepID=UPI0039C2A7FC